MTTPIIPPSHLHHLREQVQGSVYVPGDEGYHEARLTWDASTFEQSPAIIVLPEKATDVVTAVTVAREHGLSIGVQSGGHGHPSPVNEAMLVNFAHMKKVHIDTKAATVWVESGARWVDVIPQAHEYGLAPLNGFAGTVGRDYESIHRTALTFCIIADTDEQARALIPGWAGAVFPGDVGSYGLIGTLETIRQRLAAYEAAGVQELVISFFDATHLDAVRLFAKTFIA